MSSANPPAGPRADRRSLQAAVVILTASLLVLGPVVVKEAPRERARWYYAAALEHREHGRQEAALSALQTALQLDSRQPDYYLLRAEILLERDETQKCIQDLSQAVAVSPSDRLYDVYVRRAEFLQKLKLWANAVDDWKQLLRHFEDPHSLVRFPARLRLHELQNGLAYARALANIELDAALEDVNKALAALDEEPKDGPRSGWHSQLLATYLDTRGYVYYRKGELSKALQDLDTAVTTFSTLRVAQRGRIAEARKQRVNTRDLDEQSRIFDHTLAVVLQHRMLVNDVLDPAAAEQDEHAIRELGQDPNAKLF
jgi:tetratricopeptide (TPR) repeat protein